MSDDLSRLERMAEGPRDEYMGPETNSGAGCPFGLILLIVVIVVVIHFSGSH